MKGQIPRKTGAFSVRLPCTGNLTGIASFSIGLEILSRWERRGWEQHYNIAGKGNWPGLRWSCDWGREKKGKQLCWLCFQEGVPGTGPASPVWPTMSQSRKLWRLREVGLPFDNMSQLNSVSSCQGASVDQVGKVRIVACLSAPRSAWTGEVALRQVLPATPG